MVAGEGCVSIGSNNKPDAALTSNVELITDHSLMIIDHR